MYGRAYDGRVVGPSSGGSEMAIEDWDLNLFTSDPTLLERASDAEYERAAAALERIADPRRLRLLHALSLGEDTAQRAAVWAGVDQSYAERELAALVLSGVVERRESPHGPLYQPRDGHLVVELHVALAHGREGLERHPRLLRPRQRMTVRGRRAG
jgi:DNA-binding transcriptional ArsR family regulator